MTDHGGPPCAFCGATGAAERRLTLREGRASPGGPNKPWTASWRCGGCGSHGPVGYGETSEAALAQASETATILRQNSTEEALLQRIATQDRRMGEYMNRFGVELHKARSEGVRETVTILLPILRKLGLPAEDIARIEQMVTGDSEQ